MLSVYISANDIDEDPMAARTRTPKPRALDENGVPVPFERKLKDGGKLHTLLIKACPPDPVTGAQSVPLLAKKLDMSKQALNYAVARGKVRPGLAQKIVDLADGRVTLSDFTPFVFN
jgi:hypothetical protein